MSVQKYHIAQSGAKQGLMVPCHAVKEPCSFGEENHEMFETVEDANTFNELLLAVEFNEVSSAQLKQLEALKEKSSRLRQNSTPITLSPKILKNSYLGAEVSVDEIRGFEEELLKLDEEMPKYMEKRDLRDQGKYHVTLISPPEFRKLRKMGVDVSNVQNFPIKFRGIGMVKQGEEQAWFVVAESSEVNDWRAEMGLDPKDLHVTLAFKNKDIHNVPKDGNTLI